jgi:hypothetical protein
MPQSKKRKASLLDKVRNLSGKSKFLLFIITFAALGAGYFAYKSFAATPSVNFSNIWVGKITPGRGHVGVDIWYATWREKTYNPCHHKENKSYGACAMSKDGPVSYYKVFGFNPEGTGFPHGIFIDNKGSNLCKSAAAWCDASLTDIQHNWGRRVTGGAIEIYPYGPDGTYNPYKQDVGGVRVFVEGFPNLANGGRYSKQVGDIALPRMGDPGIGRLNGFVTENGKVVREDKRANFDFFQEGSSLKTSTGYPVHGFSSLPSNQDGYYSSGALPVGNYKLYVTDRKTSRKIVLYLQINSPHERLDFKLDQPCFGYPGPKCEDPAK